MYILAPHCGVSREDNTSAAVLGGTTRLQPSPMPFRATAAHSIRNFNVVQSLKALNPGMGRKLRGIEHGSRE
ncbi:hypothetical protein J27TS7_19930 [Paenibacillus dendritiformis]|nr:hypothetical protein J27TS7_19930 [Paenibacillus dendritiformis]